jgi:hypothetical protein
VRRTYVLGGQTFKTKAQVTAACRDMLYARVPIDHAFLLDLLSLHQESDQKIGCGVQRFFTAPDGYGGIGFWLERVDGSKTDWSFLKCLTPPTHRQEVLAGLRYAVADQVLWFRDQALIRGAVCVITGVPVTARTVHIDHKPPKTFAALVEQFLKEQGIDFDRIAVKPTADGSTVTELADPTLAEAWAVFHAQEAELQLTSAQANLAQGVGHERA